MTDLFMAYSLFKTISIVKYVPSWFPGAGFKRKAKEWKADMMRAVNRPIELVDKELVSSYQSYKRIPIVSNPLQCLSLFMFSWP